MMEDIYILGSGGFAKEVYFLISELKKYEIAAFVDIHTKENISFHNKSIPVISEEDFLKESHTTQANLAIGLGDPKLIKKVVNKFNGSNFPNIIHPSAILDKQNIRFGKGNIITAGVIMTTHIDIDDFNIFNLNTTIGHDVKIGSYNIFNPSVNISGETTIGNQNLFGVSSVVLQQKNIGNNNVLGASSLLTKNMDNNNILIGVPAKSMIKK